MPRAEPGTALPTRRGSKCYEKLRLTFPVQPWGYKAVLVLIFRHGSNAGHSSGVAGVDAGRATPPDPRLARWGLARCCQLDPSHPVLLTRADPGVEPCLIPGGPSWSLSRLPAWPGLRSPLRERSGLASALHAWYATKCYVFGLF